MVGGGAGRIRLFSSTLPLLYGFADLYSRYTSSSRVMTSFFACTLKLTEIRSQEKQILSVDQNEYQNTKQMNKQRRPQIAHH